MWRAGIDRFSAGVKARLHLRNRNRDLRQAAASSLETDKLRLPPAFRSCRVISCGVAGYDGGRGGQAGSQRRSEIGPMTLIKAFSGGDNVVIINRWRRRAKIPDFDARCLSILELLSCNRSSLLFFFILLSDFWFFHRKNWRSCIVRVNPNRGFLIPRVFVSENERSFDSLREILLRSRR